MTNVSEAVFKVTRKPRDVDIDKLRGLAIVIMVLDHCLLVFDTSVPGMLMRFSVDRMAMPLFFLIGGHLIRRFRYSRYVPILIVGLLLPHFIPWIDAPNVLVIYAIGAYLLPEVSNRYAWVIVAIALTEFANGMNVVHGFYQPLALVALMFLGRSLPREFLHWRWVPKFLAYPGRYPLSIYVTHLFILEGLRLTLGLPIH